MKIDDDITYGPAIPTNISFVTTKPIKKKRKISPYVKELREFCSTHTISVDIDSITKEPIVYIENKQNN